ncbi:unnamed protein product [Amoebophrya sp. A120]|nr:unnamed protein product [Amoebophrya sp. A120]|eukprot:GSA120T00021397001.1
MRKPTRWPPAQSRPPLLLVLVTGAAATCFLTLSFLFPALTNAQQHQYEAIPKELADEVQTYVTSLNWKDIFLRTFSLMGLNHGCMTVCNDQITRACTNLLAESLEWQDMEAPTLDLDETMELAIALKTEARAHRELHLMGKNVPEYQPVLLSKDRKRPCKKMLDHACPVACIRRDSGNLPNQKGYIPEYEPGAFEPQFKERFGSRYSGKKWEDMDFHKEFSVFTALQDLVGLVFAGVTSQR